MGVFNKGNAPGNQSTQTTIIAQKARIEGILKLECDLHIDGYIEGKIETEYTVTVGQTGRIKGHISAGAVIVSGLIEGECHGCSIDILENGQIKGNVETSELSIAKGGRLIGEIKEPETVSNIALLAKQTPEASTPEDNEEKAPAYL